MKKQTEIKSSIDWKYRKIGLMNEMKQEYIQKLKKCKSNRVKYKHEVTIKMCDDEIDRNLKQINRLKKNEEVSSSC